MCLIKLGLDRSKTRKQAERLQYILEAPRLDTPDEWKVEIPDLAGLEGEVQTTQWSPGGKSQTKEPEPWIPEPPDPDKGEFAG